MAKRAEAELDVLSALIERGARKDVTDRTGRTPLMIATEHIADAEAFIAKYRDTPPPERPRVSAGATRF